MAPSAIRLEEVTADLLAGVDVIKVTDGVLLGTLWQRNEDASGVVIWIFVSELTPEHVDPVRHHLTELGLPV